MHIAVVTNQSTMKEKKQTQMVLNSDFEVIYDTHK